MSALSDARDVLYQALVSASPVTPWRVHRVTPDQVVAPAIWLGGVDLDRQTLGSGPGVSMIIAGFPVYAVADGKPAAQTAALDEMLAVIFDAAFACGAQPQSARSTSIDVGGASLRGSVVQVDMTIRALTLCAPNMEAAHG